MSNDRNCKPIARALAAVLALSISVHAAAADLVVSAASSLTNAFTDIAREFENRYRGTKVLVNFGGSGQLLQQIAKGAPVDIFASADQETMDKAQANGLLEAGTRADFVSNALVLVVPKDSTVSVASLADLAKKELQRVAIGNPDSVPVGRYSKSALVAAGLWGAVEQKAISTQNVRQSLDYVARGEVDAAFVYRTDAAVVADKVRIALVVPTTEPILYPVAIVKGSGTKPGARQFAGFLRSDAAQKVMEKYGFGKP
ncbi:MAG TPA: molybdate ABC transporter substrate-binding protein [Burkholderiales bacterium]